MATRDVTEKTAGTRPAAEVAERTADAGAAAEFERLYRANVDAVTAYFARRTTDPQLVADLTADTFVTVITSFESFDPRKGTARAWVFGIARHVYASYCDAYSQQQHKLQRLAGRRELDQDQVEELLERIDAERAGRGLIAALATLPELERAVIELVDVAGLRAKDAATVLGLTPGTVRMRLMRARTRLRGQAARDAPASARHPSGIAYGSKQRNHEPDEGDRK
jgi:RNA polymerase sigma-70 factor (ECF subfamily)